MKIPVIVLFLCAFCACSTSHEIQTEGKNKVSRDDLFHHINMISNQFPEYNSQQILEASNLDFYLYARLYLNPNEKDIETLKNRDGILAMNFSILNGNNSELENLKELNPLFYHHANYIVTKDEDSRKYLEKESTDLYNHALCLVAPNGNHLLKLKPVGE